MDNNENRVAHFQNLIKKNFSPRFYDVNEYKENMQ